MSASRWILLAALTACAASEKETKPAAAPAAAAPAPAAEPAPITEGNVTQASVGGLTLLVKRVPAAEMASTLLVVRGGARNWGAQDAGIELLALQVAVNGGTQALDKSAFAEKLASLGSAITSRTERDWSSILAKGPVASFEPLFGLLADAFQRPAMAAPEIETWRQRQLLGLKRTEENPDGRLAQLVNDALFAGHPYANRPDGTLESVAKLTAAQLSAHLAKLRETSRLTLVVVGDVDPAKVIALARSAWGSLPRGTFAPSPLPRPSFAAARLTTEERKIPTNYIEAMAPAPGPADAGYAAARVATACLHERLFEEVRTKRNLSYAVGAPYDVAEAQSFAGIYVTAVDPNTTLPVMQAELRRLQDSPVPEEELAGHKAVYRSQFLTGSETTDGQALLLARGLLLTGDWRWADKFLAQSATVSPAEIQDYAKKTFAKLQVVMLGDPAKLDSKIATAQ